MGAGAGPVLVQACTDAVVSSPSVRVPSSKVYRAFPELDRFSDAQCRGFVSLVQRRHPWQMVGAAALCVVSVLLTVAALFPIAIGVVSSGRRGLDGVPLPLVTLALGLPFVVSGVVGFAVRDACLRFLIRRRNTAMKCTDCGYGLLGLPATREGEAVTVRCPECGYANDMTSRIGGSDESAALRAEGNGGSAV